MFNFGRLLRYIIAYKKYDVVFFVPHLGLGGAEKVQLEIIKVWRLAKKEILLISTEKTDVALKKEFLKYATVLDISWLVKYRSLFLLFLGLFMEYCNQNNPPILIGSHSYFYYRLIPFLKQDIVKYDLVHSLTNDYKIRHEELFLEIMKKITLVIFSDYKTKKIFLEKTKFRINSILIYNAIDPIFFNSSFKFKKTINKILFIGRDDPVKRYSLFVRLVNGMSSFSFSSIGTQTNNKMINLHEYGKVKEKDKIKIIDQHDALVITSLKEGFPLVIIEAMSRGLIILTTAVGGIPSIIKNYENGIIVDNNDEDSIVTSLIMGINKLRGDETLISEISKNNHRIASEYFNYTTFKTKYLSLLEV